MKLYENITPDLAQWVSKQMVFFVGTAPESTSGHVNVSPKGLDTLRILGSERVAYLDLTGSGAESIAHLRENGRIVLMFCAFAGPPRILRFHGRGVVITPDSPQWAELESLFPSYTGARAIIDVAVTRVSTSCGYGVPTFSEPEERKALERWAENKGPEGLAAYHREKNRVSIDGLPALDVAED